MEVHYHPDSHHKRKFKDFFLEFIMIFLAVTLGFIAENIREYVSNHEQEKHYVESFVHDLIEDTTSMHIAINENEGKIDSLKKLAKLKNADFSKVQNRINLYNRSRMIGDFGLFKSNDATMMQLKTSGLQLIKKDHVADSIASYNVKLKIIDAAEATYFNGTNAAMEASQQLLDLSASDDTAYFTINTGFKNVMLPLYLDNASSLPRFFNKIDFEIGATRLYVYNIQKVLPYAERLITYLKREYNIE
jgi:hypothetical protein